ncbi:MAG TPA: DUF6599 family protein [Bryobacteraceae bacterium]|nr:DUF6599 family protein [Bryobacteraceae bacterium]
MRTLPLFLLASLLSPAAFSAILPDTIGAWQRGDPGPAPAADQKVWSEYGLEGSENASYSDAGRKFSILAWRFGDATGAMAAFDQLRPPEAKPAKLMGLAAETAEDEFVAAGNYLFLFKGYKIKPEELSHIVATVPKYAHSPLPTLPDYMPSGAQPNSERYIVGPESLARFAPSISPSVAAFHFSAEGEVATYGSKGKETTLVVFHYPSMEMARDRYPHFQQIAGAMAKRTGPLVAVVLNPANPDAAEKLLAQVKYQAAVTLPEHPPSAKDNPINLFWNIFKLVLVLAGFCVLSGLVVGGLRVVLRRAGASGDGDAMITLHLSGRP